MAFDSKLIPLFDGTDAGLSVVEWVEKAELVCRLSGGKKYRVRGADAPLGGRIRSVSAAE